MSNNHWTIGIDFGTSNTAAAHTNPVKGGVEAVNLSHDRTTMSSSVYVESPDQIDVGDVAVNKAETNPAGFVPAPKRVIPQQMFQVNGYDISAAKPVAAVLSSVVKRVAREHGDVQPSELVLTHPEAWSTNEINVLLEAAKQLGLSAAKITTISEPQAAAHYYTRAKSLDPGQRIAVFDFGGGTLDIAVLEAAENNTFNVIAARGDNTLGGKNFDAMMRQWVDEQLEDRNPDLLEYFRIQAPLQERHALEDSIRRAKELLSEASYATVVVSGRGETERFQITRGEFEALIAPALDKAVMLTEHTLADAGITNSNQLVALYLTGGSSRIPIVQERLKHFGTLATLDDPKTVVAQGAISALGPIVRGMTPQNMGASTPVPMMGQSAPPPQYGAPTPTETQSSYLASNAPSSTETATKKSSRVPIIAAAAVVVVVVLAGVGYVLVNRGQETDVTTVADPSTTAAATTSASSGAALDTLDAVMAALPANIKESLDNCVVDGDTQDGNLKIECEVKRDSQDFAYFFDPGEISAPTIRFIVDTGEASSERIRIVEGYYDERDHENTLLENDSKTAAAHLTKSTLQDKYVMHFANTDNGIVIDSFDIKDVASGEAYLKSKGLL